MDFKVDAVKIIQCKECGVDVPVNVNYPIDSVTCLRCWAKKKSDKKWQKFLKPIHAAARTQLPPWPPLVSRGVGWVRPKTRPIYLFSAGSPVIARVLSRCVTVWEAGTQRWTVSMATKGCLCIYRSRVFISWHSVTQTHSICSPTISRTYQDW